MTQDIIIIGGGAAGINAIKAIRETDHTSNIHLFRTNPYILTIEPD